MKYLVQIDDTNPQNWQEIMAEDQMDAVVIASTPAILAGNNPQMAYVALGNARHGNGAPICVQGYSLTVNRTQDNALLG